MSDGRVGITGREESRPGTVHHRSDAGTERIDPGPVAEPASDGLGVERVEWGLDEIHAASAGDMV